MTLPNFLIVGVQKAGTTSLYNYLREHPQVYMSPVKETEFLSYKPPLDSESASLSATDLLTRGGRKRILTIEAYRELFDGVQDEIAIGEASPNYLFLHEQSVPMIKKYVPDAKLIVVLRNPVERAYSDYLMNVRELVGNRKPLAEQVVSSAQSSYTLLKGRYYAGIKHFLEAFAPEQIQILMHSDLTKDSDRFMSQLYDFIGVDSSFKANTQKRQQTAQVPKNQNINKLLRTRNPLRSAAGAVLRAVMPEAQRQKLRSRLIAANSQGKEGLPLTDEDRRLLENYYREDILRLQDLIDTDLSAWFKVTQLPPQPPVERTEVA